MERSGDRGSSADGCCQRGAGARRIQGRLEGGVELPGANRPAMHGREHLDVRQGIQPVPGREPPMGQVHDELVFELPTAEAERHSKWIAEEMTSAIRLDVPLKVDVTYGPSWLAEK